MQGTAGAAQSNCPGVADINLPLHRSSTPNPAASRTTAGVAPISRSLHRRTSRRIPLPARHRNGPARMRRQARRRRPAGRWLEQPRPREEAGEWSGASTGRGWRGLGPREFKAVARRFPGGLEWRHGQHGSSTSIGTRPLAAGAARTDGAGEGPGRPRPRPTGFRRLQGRTHVPNPVQPL